MNKISGTIPPEIGLLTALTELRVPPASPTHGAARDRPSASQVPRPQPDHRPDPERGRQAHGAEAAASSPRVPDARRGARSRLGVAGSSSTTRSTVRSRPSFATSRCVWPKPAPTSSPRAARTAAMSGVARARSLAGPTIPRRRRGCEFPPRPRRPARRATDPRRRRDLNSNKITGPIPAEIGQLTALTALRVPPASTTPGAPRDRPSTSQVPQLQRDHRPDPGQDRRAHGADVPASSPRVPDARRAARPNLGVAGTSAISGAHGGARSRPRSASSRR